MSKTLLEELSSLSIEKNKILITEARARHIIESANNLILYIENNFNSEVASDLIKRFNNSIRTQDYSKFEKGIKNVKKEYK